MKKYLKKGRKEERKKEKGALMDEHFGTAVTIILQRRNFWLSNI